ncbi:MAG: recombination protein O N-terminal domain-containing protein, partial [Candidatus Latescibacterota bacterium]|nr:recombination protein O N-terminal domain-containing protein [Candidatus Latescibacterota bacterium]
MARVIVKTDAVVLRTMRMGETSKLVTLFSEKHGKLKVMAKG